MFGYNDVETAENGPQGIAKAEEKSYDLILMDIRMPIMDGFSALKELQDSDKTGNPAVVALTADALGVSLCLKRGVMIRADPIGHKSTV